MVLWVNVQIAGWETIFKHQCLLKISWHLQPSVLRLQVHNINPRLVADAVPVLARPRHALRHRRVRAVRRERERLPGEERDGGADHRPLQVLHSYTLLGLLLRVSQCIDNIYDLSGPLIVYCATGRAAWLYTLHSSIKTWSPLISALALAAPEFSYSWRRQPAW